MELRIVKDALESLSTGVVGGVADEELLQYIDKLSEVCLTETGIPQPYTIIPLLTRENGNLCASVERCMTAQDAYPTTISVALEFLSKLLNACHQQPDAEFAIVQSVTQIKNICFGVWGNCKQAKNRIDAVKLLESLVVFCNTPGKLKKDLNLGENLKNMIQEIKRNSKNISVTVKQPLYKFLGTIARHDCDTIDDYADDLLKIFFSELQKETDPKTKSPKFSVITGCFDGINGFLFNFSDSVESAQLAGFQTGLEFLFDRCAKILHIREVPRYAMVFSSLKLLEAHLDKFQGFLLLVKGNGDPVYRNLYQDLNFWTTHPVNREAQKFGYAALETFLKEISHSIVSSLQKDLNSTVAKSAYAFFIERFDATMQNAENSRDFTLALRGYGYFMRSCLLLTSAKHAKTLISEMICKSEQMFTGRTMMESMEESLASLPSFIEALALMVYSSDCGLPEAFLFASERLCVLLMDSFPRLTGFQQHFGWQALVKVIFVANKLSSTSDELVSSIVYQGLVRSCSYPIPMEDLEDGPLTVNKKGISFKDYILLWEKLVSCDIKEPVLADFGASETDLSRVAEICFDELMKATLRIIKSLNFDFITVDTEDENVTPVIMPVNKKPSKDQDFQIFYSLEQLLTPVLKKSSPENFKRWCSTFCRELISLLEKNPLVAGLYRLLSNWWIQEREAACITVNENMEFDTEDDISNVMEVDGPPVDSNLDNLVIPSFLSDLIGKLHHFTGEVLIAALQLILNAPSHALKPCLSLLEVPLILSLQTGRGYLPLAETAVDALGRFCLIDFSAEDIAFLFPRVLPLLDHYLQSQTVDVVERSKLTSSRSSKRRLKVLLVPIAPDLTKIRAKILRFLGQLGGKFSHYLLGGDFSENVKERAIVWDMENHLQFSVPFSDMVLRTFYLDDFVPRVCELSLNSPDRATKVAACELLHGMTVFVVATNASMTPDRRNWSTLLNFVEKLFPQLLELACDVEPITKQMFNPLVSQIVHWFSRNAHKASREAEVILDCIMDGLVSERNSMIRDFSAECLARYLDMIIKTFGNTGDVPVATISLFDRLISFAGHSSCVKRFGAALAFNHCYKIFREDRPTVSMFSISLIVVYTRSLALAHYDSGGIDSAKVTGFCLDHLSGIVRKYGQVFIKPSSSRRLCVALKKPKLKDLVDWLVLQACRPETECRMKSLELFENLGAILYDAQDAAYYFNDLKNNKQFSWLLNSYMNGGFDPTVENRSVLSLDLLKTADISLQSSILEKLAAPLDCVTWSFRKIYLKPSDGIDALPEWKDFICIVEQLVTFIHGWKSVSGVPVSSLVRFQKAKCFVLIRLTDLIISLLSNFNSDGAKIIPQALCDEKYFEIVIRMLLEPSSLGFISENVDVFENLRRQMRSMLSLLVQFFGSKFRDGLTGCVAKFLNTGNNDLVKDMLEDKRIPAALVDGFCLTHSIGLSAVYLDIKNMDDYKLSKELGNFIAIHLKSKYESCGHRSNLWSAIDISKEKSAFKILLYIVNDFAEIVQRFVLCSENSEIYSKLNGTLFRHIFSDDPRSKELQNVFVERVLEKSATLELSEFDLRNKLMKHALTFLVCNKTARKAHGMTFVASVVTLYGPFLSDENRKFSESVRTSLDVLRLILLLDHSILKKLSPGVELVVSYFVWIIGIPSTKDPSVSSMKTYALSQLPFFLSSSARANVEKAIEDLSVNDFPIKAAELVHHTSRRIHYLDAVSRLLDALEVCPNFVLFSVCVNILARDSNHPLLDRFQKVFESMIFDDHSETIQSYFAFPFGIFFDTHVEEARIVVIDNVLIPMLRASTSTVILEFFTRNLRSILENVDPKCSCSDEVLLTMRCSFSLLEILFSSISKNQLVDPRSRLTATFLEIRSSQKVVTGKELLEFVIRTTDAVVHENFDPKLGQEELRRVLHCAAYRTLVASLTVFQKDAQPDKTLKFYQRFLLEESPLKHGKALWTNLIDSEHEYKFEVEFVQVPRRKTQLAAIHRELAPQNKVGGSSSISSGLFTATSYASVKVLASSLIRESSLADDIGRFDLSSELDRKQSELYFGSVSKSVANDMQGPTSSVILESDELNKHECMATVVALIQHMVEKKITDTEGSVPNWILAWLDQLKSFRASLNIKLFLVKVMINVENSEIPYFFNFAGELYNPIIHLILAMNIHAGLNYFVIDLIHMMLKWTIRKPPGVDQRELAQKLFTLVIRNTPHENSQVQRNNLTLLKVISESWRSLLVHPVGDIITSLLQKEQTNFKKNIVCINMIAIMLNNDLPLAEQNVEEYQKLLTTHMMVTSKTVFSVAALTIGLLIAQMRVQKLDSSVLQKWVDNFFVTNGPLANYGRFIVILHELGKSCPDLAAPFIRPILLQLSHVKGESKRRSLEILINVNGQVDRPYKEFLNFDMMTLLSDRDEAVQGLTLRYLEVISDRITADELQTLFTDAREFKDLFSTKSPLLRQQSYELCMKLYDRFEAKEDAASEKLKSLIRGNLFAGLKDRDAMIRQTLTNFWKDDKRLTGATFSRLQTIFETFTDPELQSSFLATACQLVMDLCRRSPTFSQPMFNQPLSDCEFFKQNIEISWKQRAMMAPVTSGTFASTSFSGTLGLLRRSPRAPLFTPTQVEGGTVSPSLDGSAGFSYGSQFSQSLMIHLPYRTVLGAGTGDNRQLSQESVALNQVEKDMSVLQRRFQKADGEKSRIFFVRYEMERKKHREEILKEERERQGLQVRLSRDYRLGEDPDVQIPCSAIIEPLQTLAEHDSQIASLLLTKLFGGIVDESRKTELANQVEDGLASLALKFDLVMKNNEVSDVMFLTTLLNVITADKTTKMLEKISAEAISLAAIRSRQVHTGITTLEHSIELRTTEPSSKKGKQGAERSRHWLELYRLFRAIEETDSIEGLQLDKVFRNSVGVKLAVHAEAQGKLGCAMQLYGDLKNNEVDNNVTQLLTDSFISCLNKLGRWRDVERRAIPEAHDRGEVTFDMNAIWDNLEDKERLLYYAIRSRLKQAMNFNEPAKRSLKAFFEGATSVPGRKDYMERNFAYESCLFNLCLNNHTESDYYLTCAVDKFLEDWAGTPQLNLYGRQKLLPRIQLFEETQRYRKTLDEISSPSKKQDIVFEELLNYFVASSREPSPLYGITESNDLILNRCFYANDLQRKIQPRMNPVITESFVVHEKLHFIRTANEQHYFGVAAHWLDQTRRLATDIYAHSTYFSAGEPPETLGARFTERCTETAIDESTFCNSSSEVRECVKKLTSAIKMVNEGAAALKTHSQQICAMKFKKARIFHAMASLVSHQSISLDEVSLETQESFGLLTTGLNMKSLNLSVFNELSSACHEKGAKPTSTMFLQLFKFCDEILEKGYVPDDQLVSSGSSALLSAIRFGNLEARDLFGRLLIWLGQYSVVGEIVRTNTGSIPTWIFLTWANQMLALLDKKEGAGVHQILLDLATEYPQALYYGFKISKAGYIFDEKDNFCVTNRFAFDQLSSKLSLPIADEFVRQLELFYEPHMFFLDFLKKADQLVREKKKDQLKKEFADIYNDLLAEPSGEQMSSLNSSWTKFIIDCRYQIVSIFGREGKKVSNFTVQQFRKDKEVLDKFLKDDLQKRSNSTDAKMSDVSPWLADFSALKFGSVLEIPGQYGGREKVRPELHVKVASFGEQVKTMDSIRRPRRIVFRGDDEKEYPFLIKGGEDLRLDQRIEQLFDLMNHSFEKDPNCCKRRLKIHTYSVVPMTVRVGIIQWVQNTVPLRDFLMKANDRLKESLFDETREAMREFLKTAFSIRSKVEPDAKSLYSEASLKISREEMRTRFASMESKFYVYTLRDQIRKLTVSPEAFIIVRNLFAEAYGTLAIGQYILGIGDRHLQNFLVSLDSGSILPIDFGHAFGSATQFLPVPELVPIRMTRQFIQMMAPVSKQGKLQQTMIHALQALRKDQQILLATMDVFVQEPSIDWLQFAKRLTPISGSQSDDLRWFPRDKVEIAKRKLEGGNPTAIMCTEIGRSICSGIHLQKLKEIILGDKTENDFRATQPEAGLSVENQVECLMDQSLLGMGPLDLKHRQDIADVVFLKKICGE